jgi:hypothetical protein
MPVSKALQTQRRWVLGFATADQRSTGHLLLVVDTSCCCDCPSGVTAATESQATSAALALNERVEHTIEERTWLRCLAELAHIGCWACSTMRPESGLSLVRN